MQEALVDCTVWALWGILNVVDATLTVWSNLFGCCNNKRATSEIPTRVVIVGASFAGLAVHAKVVALGKHVEVVVVDAKDYFEYVPGVLRCFVEPQHFSHLTSPLCTLEQSHANTKVVTGKVVSVNSTKNEIQLQNGQSLPFDYLVLTMGSSYTSAPIIKGDSSKRQRQAQWNDQAAKVKQAQRIIVVGAGAVGVELVAEIASAYPNKTKSVFLVDMASSILPGFHPKSIQYATRWLETHGAQLLLGTPLSSIRETTITFASGKTLYADLIYKCFGGKPNSTLVKHQHFEFQQGPRGSIVVNDHFQVMHDNGSSSYDNIFGAGDVCFHEGTKEELKLGHNAELQGHLVGENILECIRCSNQSTTHLVQAKLKVYPNDIVKASAIPMIYDLSLGKYNGTLRFNSIVINGPLAAIMKWMIEYTQVAQKSNRPVGVLFWKFADWFSALLGRTIVPTPFPKPPLKEQ